MKTLIEICALLDTKAVGEARELARESLAEAPIHERPSFPVRSAPDFDVHPKVPVSVRTRMPRPQEKLSFYLRDGFVDRLSPERWRLVFPGTTRLISMRLNSGQTDQAIHTHLRPGTALPRCYAHNAPIWFDLWPTLEHALPRARGGTNDSENVLTASWWRNVAKEDRTVEECGWTRADEEPPSGWDGLINWFVLTLAPDPYELSDTMVAHWAHALIANRDHPRLKESRGSILEIAGALDAMS